jgi:hypothetical protein
VLVVKNFNIHYIHIFADAIASIMAGKAESEASQGFTIITRLGKFPLTKPEMRDTRFTQYLQHEFSPGIVGY